jgi:diadenosine tetraphosphatase ApaH/serine/threonine PP2A family protein phosphatase
MGEIHCGRFRDHWRRHRFCRWRRCRKVWRSGPARAVAAG